MLFVIQPNPVRVTSVTTVKLHFNAVFGRAWVGRRLRLLVLDELFLLDAHAEALKTASNSRDPLALFRKHGWFDTPIWPGEKLPAFLREAKADSTRGILLSAELQPGREMPMAKGTGFQFTGFRFPDRSAAKFSFEPAKNPARPRLSFRVNLDDFEVDPSGKIVEKAVQPDYELAVLPIDQKRTNLILVLASAEPAAFRGESAEEYSEGTIVFSSLWRTDWVKPGHPNVSKYPHVSNVPVTIEVALPAAPRKPVAGGPGEVPLPAPAPRTPAPIPDITGQYECYRTNKALEACEDPDLMLQLNWAQGAVAGWFAWPTRGSTTSNPTDLPPLVQFKPGCLLGQSGSKLLRWFQGDAPDRENIYDPHDLEGAALREGQGTLIVEQGKKPLRLNLLLESGGTSLTLFCVRVNDRPRTSRARLDGLVEDDPTGRGASVRTAIIGEEVAPLPQSFWLRVEQFVGAPPTPLGPVPSSSVPPRNLADAIRRWEESPPADSGAGAKGKRGAEADTTGELLCRELFRPFGITLSTLATFHKSGSHPHYPLIRAYFVALATRSVLRIGARSFTLHDWLKEIVSGELERIREDNPDTPTAALFTRVHEGFKLVGIDAAGEFVYRFKFSPFGAQGTLVVGVGGYYFRVTITKHLTRGGPATDANKDASFGTVTMHGLFGDLSYGAKASFGVEAGWKGAGGPASSGPSGAIDFRSFHDIRADALNVAHMWLTAVKGPGVSGGIAGFGASLTGVSGMIMSITIPDPDIGKSTQRGDIHLVAEVVAVLKEGGSLPSRVTDLRPSASWGVGLLSASLGGGRMVRLDHDPGPPPKTQPTAKASIRRRYESYFAVYFVRNQSVIDPMSRIALLEALALERAVFTSTAASIAIRGHSSPEGTVEENLSVSRGRASSAEVVVREAFAGRLDGVEISTAGLGQEESDLKGLVDPKVRSADPELQRRRERQFIAEELKRAEQRRVDIVINGELVLEVRVQDPGTNPLPRRRRAP